MKSKTSDKKQKSLVFPTVEELQRELHRERYQQRFRKVLRSTVYALVTVAAVAVLVATLWMPVLQCSGNSMAPTLTDGEIVISLRGSKFETGDVIAFYFDNKVLVKRVIANSGDWVNIDTEGNVYVNDVLIDEPYLVEKDQGYCNIQMPYQVPEEKIFVMGDNRSVSVDSRNTALGCVPYDSVVGRLVFRVWPFDVMGGL